MLLLISLGSQIDGSWWEVINDPVVLVTLMDVHLEFDSVHLGQLHLTDLGSVHRVYCIDHIR